jgi:hypothetical protein
MKNNVSSFNEFVNENSNELPINEKEMRSLDQFDAGNFISDVLKLGSRQNLFDSYMKKNGIKPDELSTFVNQVIDKLDKDWR